MNRDRSMPVKLIFYFSYNINTTQNNPGRHKKVLWRWEPHHQKWTLSGAWGISEHVNKITEGVDNKGLYAQKRIILVRQSTELKLPSPT